MPDSLEWMPAGEHTIYATKAGKPHKATMRVKPEHAALVNAQLAELNAAADAGTADRVYFDFNHEDREASAHPTEFFWENGIRARVKWTGAGDRAVRGRDYTRFSPSFFADDAGNVIGIPVNAGGLVNRAAFQKIQSVVRSKSAGAEGDPAEQEQQTERENEPTMKSLLAVLAKLGLTTSAEVDEATAVTQVTAKFNELSTAASNASSELTQVKAKLTDTETKLDAAQTSFATTAVEAAIAAGRIPGQNAEVKAKWVGLLKADPTNASLLPEPNAALQQVVTASGAQGAQTQLNGNGAQHPFMAKVTEYQANTKSSEAFAIEAVARTPEGAKLYESYRETLYGKA